MLAKQEPSSLGAHISRRPDLQLQVVWDPRVWKLISADVQIFSYEWYGIIHTLTIPHFIDNALLLSITTPFRYHSSSQYFE